VPVSRAGIEKAVQPYHFSMLGLGLDIVGAFLVAVEAIKLENLRVLRDRVLRHLHALTLSPRLIVVDDAGQPIGPVPPPVPADRYPRLFMVLHNVAGLLVVVALNELLDGRVYRFLRAVAAWAWDQAWYLGGPLLVLLLVSGLGPGLWLVGEFVHIGATKAVQIPIRLLDFIDSRTPDGTVGVLGFILLFAGFVLQMYGSYLSGRAQCPPLR
jgi:hypothetical protein